MGQNEIRAAIEAAVDYLTKHPDDAKYTDSSATARLASLDGLRVDVAGPNGAQMKTDMPTSVGGTNTTASPGWYLRAAEASCVVTLIAMRAAQLSQRLEELEVTVDSESNDWGILGITGGGHSQGTGGGHSQGTGGGHSQGTGGAGDQQGQTYPAGPLTTRIAVKIRGDGDLRSLVDWAIEHCPVTDAIKRPIPIAVEVDTDGA